MTQTEATDPELLRLWVLQDSNEDLYERRVYSIMDLIGQLGGFFEMLLIIGGVLINSFREKAYLYSVFNKLYTMRNDHTDSGITVKVNGSTVTPKSLVRSQKNLLESLDLASNSSKPKSLNQFHPSPQTPINTPCQTVDKDSYF